MLLKVGGRAAVHRGDCDNEEEDALNDHDETDERSVRPVDPREESSIVPNRWEADTVRPARVSAKAREAEARSAPPPECRQTPRK